MKYSYGVMQNEPSVYRLNNLQNIKVGKYLSVLILTMFFLTLCLLTYFLIYS